MTSIFRQIIVPVVAVMAALAAAVTWLSYDAGRDAVDRLIQARMTDATGRAEEFIGALVQESHLVTQMVAESASAGDLDPANHAALEPLLFRLTSLSARAPYIYAADPKGGFIGVNRARLDEITLLRQLPGEPERRIWFVAEPGDRSRPQPKMAQRYDSRTRPWYQLATQASGPVWTPVYGSVRSGLSILTLAVPVKRVNGDLRGVIGMNLPLDNLQRLLVRLNVSPGARVFILERDGGFVVGTADGKELRPPGTPFVTGVQEVRHMATELPDELLRESAGRILAAGMGPGESFSSLARIAGEEVMISATRLARADSPDWIVGVSLPRAAFMKDVVETLWRGIGLALLALAAAIAVGVFSVSRVTRDMVQLRRAAEALGVGRWDARLPLERSDELGVLAHSFSSMRDQVRSSLKTIQEQNRELEALNAGLEAKVAERTEALAAQARELADKNRQLEGAVQLREEVDRIARHDMRTPINSIVAVPRLLRESGRLGREDEELLGVVEQSGYRILNMVNLSLDLYRMEQGSYRFRPQAVDMAGVVDKVLRDVRGHAAAKQVDIVVKAKAAEAAPGVRVLAWAEELLCYTILANLLKNAVEASPDGGRVTVSLDVDRAVTVRIHNPGAVPGSVRERFFEKYATAGKAGGSGLGTYSARMMAQVQEGELTMETSDAGGTTLTLTLGRVPEGAPQPATAQVAAAAESEPGLPALKVLVADDDEYNLVVMRRYLPNPPIELETVVNGRAALDAAIAHSPDLMFMDLDMPVMGGLEAARRLRDWEKASGRRRCAIVAFSSYDDDVSRARALAAGCDHYVGKPVSRETIHGILRGWSASGEFPAAPAAVVRRDAEPDPVVVVDRDLQGAIDGFLRSRKALLEDAAAALDAGDRTRVKRVAHQLAGSFGLYGFRWASERARGVELEAERGERGALIETVRQLRAHLDGVRIEFRDEEAGRAKG